MPPAPPGRWFRRHRRYHPNRSENPHCLLRRPHRRRRLPLAHRFRRCRQAHRHPRHRPHRFRHRRLSALPSSPHAAVAAGCPVAPNPPSAVPHRPVRYRRLRWRRCPPAGGPSGSSTAKTIGPPPPPAPRPAAARRWLPPRPRTRRSRAAQGLHELGVKRAGLRAERLKRLAVLGEQRRHRRRDLIGAGSHQPGGRSGGRGMRRIQLRTDALQIRRCRLQPVRNHGQK